MPQDATVHEHKECHNRACIYGVVFYIQELINRIQFNENNTYVFAVMHLFGDPSPKRERNSNQKTLNDPSRRQSSR